MKEECHKRTSRCMNECHRPQSTTHRSHEKSKPLSEENTGIEMLSTCKIFPELKNDNARILSLYHSKTSCMYVASATIHKYYTSRPISCKMNKSTKEINTGAVESQSSVQNYLQNSTDTFWSGYYDLSWGCLLGRGSNESRIHLIGHMQPYQVASPGKAMRCPQWNKLKLRPQTDQFTILAHTE